MTASVLLMGQLRVKPSESRLWNVAVYFSASLAPKTDSTALVRISWCVSEGSAP